MKKLCAFVSKRASSELQPEWCNYVFIDFNENSYEDMKLPPYFTELHWIDPNLSNLIFAFSSFFSFQFFFREIENLDANTSMFHAIWNLLESFEAKLI